MAHPRLDVAKSWTERLGGATKEGITAAVVIGRIEAGAAYSGGFDLPPAQFVGEPPGCQLNYTIFGPFLAERVSEDLAIKRGGQLPGYREL